MRHRIRVFFIILNYGLIFWQTLRKRLVRLKQKKLIFVSRQK